MLSNKPTWEHSIKPSNIGRKMEKRRRESRPAMPVSPMPKPPAISIDIQTLSTSNPRRHQLPPPRSITTTGVFTRVDKSTALQESLISKLSAISTSMRIFKLLSEPVMFLGSRPRTISIRMDSLREDSTNVREDQFLSAVVRDHSANVTVWFSTLQFITMELKLMPQPLQWISLNPSSGASDKRTQETIKFIAETKDSETSPQAEQSNAGARPQSQESHNLAVERVKTVDAQPMVRFSTVPPLPPLIHKPLSRNSQTPHTL